jgi:hypothetical protein
MASNLGFQVQIGWGRGGWEGGNAQECVSQLFLIFSDPETLSLSSEPCNRISLVYFAQNITLNYPIVLQVKKKVAHSLIV